MSSSPKTHRQQPVVEPVVIDNSEQTRKLEESRKKRRGAAMTMVAGNTSLSGNEVRKTALGE